MKHILIRNVHDKVVGTNNLNGDTYVKTNLKMF